MIRLLLEGFQVNEIKLSSLITTLEEAKQYGDIEPVNQFKRTLEKIISKAMEKRHRIFFLIEKLEDPIIKQIFYSRFIDDKSNAAISKELGYSINHISKKIRKGIEELEKLEE